MESSSLPLMYMSLLVLLFSHCLVKSSSDDDLIHSACKRAAESDPQLSYDFCVKSLGETPKSQSAIHIEDLGFISIQLTISNATYVSSCIAKLLDDQSVDPFAKSCLQDCSELYTDAISTLKDAVHVFNSGDYYKASMEVSSVMDASTTCEEGFGDKEGEVSPLTKENDIVFQLTAMALAITNMLQY